jgi:GNAT superfamily N-acetyltransferase
VFQEHPLDVALHQRSDFDCGVPALNDYLHRFAHQQRQKGLAAVYVLTRPERPERIVGFYTLGAAEVGIEDLAAADQKQLPRYRIPCFRMGRLATRCDCRGEGIGKLLLGCAVERCLRARAEVAAFALIVDAKDERVRDFYLHFGFTAFASKPLSLYLPLGRSELAAG